MQVNPVINQLFGNALIDEWCRIANVETTFEREERILGYFPERTTREAFDAGVQQGLADTIRNVLMTLGINWKEPR